MAVISKNTVASFDTYSEVVNQFGELVITATKGGQTYVQTVDVSAPSTLFWDSSNGNFLVIPLTIDPTTLQFVENILSITQ